MFQTLFRQNAALQRHQTGPLAAERRRYLRHCAAGGAPDGEQRKRAKCLLWIAKRLVPRDRQGVNAERLHEIVHGRPSPGPTMAQVLLEFGRPWLKFLGWWRTDEEPIPFAEHLESYLTWMRQERGFSLATVHGRIWCTTNFLRWCGQSGRDLASLRPHDLDAYFATFGDRWSRISVASMATRLRAFLRYAASIGACPRRLPDAILSPRIYQLESLPYALSWEEVHKLLASTASASPRDIRDRAILMLLAVYGLRRGEVAALRLDQIDWAGRRLWIHRLKRRQPQVYPLQRSVAEVLSRYVDTVRPRVPYPEVFIRLQAPHQPIGDGAIYHVVSERLRALGIKAAHLGPHALRHSCAARLLADRLTLKEIGDHLGHRSAAATRIYTKVDLAALREVGDFDLGDLP
jgi:integrase/recombinase XerD